MAVMDEKPEVLRVDDARHLDIENGPEKVDLRPEADDSGAREKTDPRELKLVKKLDRWIMPMLWGTLWLNYLDRNVISLARLNDLEDDR